MDQAVFSHPKVYQYINKNILFVKVNVDTDIGKNLKRTYKIKAYPTYILLKKGKEVGREVAKTSYGKFLNWITSYVN